MLWVLDVVRDPIIPEMSNLQIRAVEEKCRQLSDENNVIIKPIQKEYQSHSRDGQSKINW
jgi:hypothetical protein